MKTSYKLFILLLFLSTTALHSQVARDRLEKNNNRYEIITAKQQVKRDMREIESFRDLVQDFKLYYLSEDVDQVNEVRAKLIADMDREIRQNTAKASAGKREVKRSSKEVENSEKDLRETMEKSSGVSRRIWFLADRETRAERKDHADDIRDLADDENDLVQVKVVTRIVPDAEIIAKLGKLPDVAACPADTAAPIPSKGGGDCCQVGCGAGQVMTCCGAIWCCCNAGACCSPP